MMAVCADTSFVLSNHAATRMAQRSIRSASLELVLLYRDSRKGAGELRRIHPVRADCQASSGCRL